MNNRHKILVIEDETNILRFVTALLEANDFQVLTARTAQAGRLMYSSHVPDLIILDLGLPDADGMEFLIKLRETASTPVIVLSARTNEEDKVNSLDGGANDYITKPFSSAELLARIRNVLRNYRRTADNIADGVFSAGVITIDYGARKFLISGNEIKLTQTEFNILAYLSENFGKVVTYSSIIKAIWGIVDAGSTKKLQVNMANIRKKLCIEPGENRIISNELGVGYRMHNDSE